MLFLNHNQNSIALTLMEVQLAVHLRQFRKKNIYNDESVDESGYTFTVVGTDLSDNVKQK